MGYKVYKKENSELILDKDFENLYEAKNYVVVMNMLESELSILISDIKDYEQREEFLNEFCFGDNYIHLAKYFLGKPNF